MQNRGALLLFTILLGLACIYQLSFSFITRGVEADAYEFAVQKADSAQLANSSLTPLQYDSILVASEDRYLKQKSFEEVYPVFGYTYGECKEKEINLGLDLQGGMSVTLEVSIPEMIVNLAANPNDADFAAAIQAARDLQTESQDDFITLFAGTYAEQAPNGKLAAVFHNRDNKDKFPRTATNEEIILTLREEAQAAIDNTEKILRTRIDKFGVVQPTIQKQQYSGRISIDLPGVKDKERVRKVLQSTANLEFWETYQNSEVYPLLEQADKALSEALYPGEREKYEEELAADTVAADTEETANDTASSDALEDLLGSDDSTADATEDAILEGEQADRTKVSPLFSKLQPAIFQGANGQFQLGEGSIVGYASVTDTIEVNRLLNNKAAKGVFPKDMKLLWGSKARGNAVELFSIRVTTRDGKAPLDGGVIVDARQDFNVRGDIEVAMQMNAEGANTWAEMTRNNIGKSIAIVLDNSVQSAPTVQGEIPGGRSSISMGSGNRGEQLNEAEDLANILKAGALPAPAQIVDESIVGPSLGADNISSGLSSMLIALGMILLYMIFYYSKAGIVADVALVSNLFLLIGTLASMQASLTLPGIAGIVLTIGMSVDANVLIYERVKEELRKGSALKTALEEGYKKAASAIIDSNLTTLLTAIVLAVFGSGPIKGFATTLIIGIFTSLFSAIFITRLIFTSKGFGEKVTAFASKATENAFTKINIEWVGKRKMYYVISALVILGGIGSMASRGFDLGVDFTGGRTYTVKFEQPVDVDQVRNALDAPFNGAPEVKTIGGGSQLKITTNYLISESGSEIDGKVEAALSQGLNTVVDDYTIEESRKVDPTISDDIVQSAVLAVTFALLIIFVYILGRFRRWQFGLGALTALFHDILIVLSLFSIFHGILPINLEIDQAFIAALLTVLGYSINDTVVVFDRVREFIKLKGGNQDEGVINSALNSTLGRTVNTSLTTFAVLLMIFLFGGDSIRGFVFALMVGVVVGTYSSLCIATPVVVDFSSKKQG